MACSGVYTVNARSARPIMAGPHGCRAACTARRRPGSFVQRLVDGPCIRNTALLEIADDLLGHGLRRVEHGLPHVGRQRDDLDALALTCCLEGFVGPVV